MRTTHTWTPMRVPSREEWLKLCGYSLLVLDAIAQDSTTPIAFATTPQRITIGEGAAGLDLERLDGSGVVHTEENSDEDRGVRAVLVIGETMGLLRVTGSSGTAAQWDDATAFVRGVLPTLYAIRPAVTRVCDDGRPRVVSTVDTCGGRPRIAGTRITVEALAALRRHGRTDAEIEDLYSPYLSAANLRAAWDYCCEHGISLEPDTANETEGDHARN